MYAATAAAKLHRMSQVKHLMVNKVLDRIAWNARTIKDPADNNSVVRRIVMSKALARVAGTPGHLRTRHQAVEEPGIQVVKNLFQVVVRTLGAMDLLAPAHLPDQMSFSRDALAAGKLAKAGRMAVVDLLPIKLGNEDVKDGVQYVVRSTFHQVREPHQNLSFTQTNGVIEIGKRKELDRENWNRRSGTQLPVRLLKKTRNSRIHRIQISTRGKVRKN